MIKCENTYCKHHGENNKCNLKKAVIGIDSMCQNFEKGFMYYFYYFTNMNSNFITMFDLKEDMRYSIYYLMKCLPIVFSEDYNRGIIVLRDAETDKLLTVKDICKMIQSDKMDWDEFQNCIYDFEESGLPNPNPESKVEVKVDHQPFGWLSPTGEFTEGDWGDHEIVANEIINKKGFTEEYDKYEEESILNDCRGFLSEIKGYVLIHDPSNLGYIVTNTKPLTKKQKDFLYGYFLDMGMKGRAEGYLED